MAITKYNSETKKKEDIKSIIKLLLILFFVIWISLPPYNKIDQICYVVNNIIHAFDKEDNREWIFHRNNAVFLARMKNQRGAIAEINKAIQIIPSNEDERNLMRLYKDRGQIYLYFENYKAALDDYARSKNDLDITDKFKLALLFKENGNRKWALKYCYEIMDIDTKAYSAYACIADIYADAGRPDASIVIFDLLIDRVPNNANYYAERANYKKKTGDMKGYNQDMAKARELSPSVKENFSLIEETMHPKQLRLSII